MNADKERRQNRRYDLSIPIVIDVPGEARDVAGQTRDIGTAGVYFVTEKKFEVGDQITFILSLPPDITLAGVVRVKGHGIVLRVNTAGGVAVSIQRYEFLPQ